MSSSNQIAPIRLLPEEVANKIAAGEVVERPASVVKELVENAIDAGATRVAVRIVGAGRRLIEVTDNGHGMSEQDALMSIERHATSKIRKADDLDNIQTLGFRGEALASIAAVSRFELVTRRARDASATQLKIDGGILRSTGQVGAPQGTRVAVNRLYFNTPVRAKFLKGITTELSHCIDVVQRHALANTGVGFQLIHNDKMLMDIPEHATLRERVALIWGLKFVNDMVEFSGEQAGFRISGLAGTPALTRSSRSHQFFFLNGRPVVNRSLQFGFEDGYQGLLTIGRQPVGVVMIETHPRFVDVNIHPSKREIRFRDERAARDAVRDVIRRAMDDLRTVARADAMERRPGPRTLPDELPVDAATPPASTGSNDSAERARDVPPVQIPSRETRPSSPSNWPPAFTVKQPEAPAPAGSVQAEFGVDDDSGFGSVAPEAVYRPVDRPGTDALQLFDTYLLVPDDDRLLIIDQHALHERMNYDLLLEELADKDYGAQQLVVPILIEVPPASARLLESNLSLFEELGLDIEPFGGNTFQVTAICHLYEESRVSDAIYKILDELSQGDLFDRDDFKADFLRVATQACRASVKAGDRLTPEEKQELLEGFRRMRPPYTCPHGRPIITELTLTQMEKSFRRRQ